MTGTTSPTQKFEQKLLEMAAQQDAALSLLLPHAGSVFQTARLCGGTALSRFYLQHRLSYDLDFFLPAGFDAQSLANQFAKHLPIRNLEITQDKVRAEQLHFTLEVAGLPVKLSFIEDMYADFSPALASPLALQGQTMLTESIDGLYHRKLRTIIGFANAEALHPAGGRQTARDLFDLYVLSHAQQSLRAFIEALPYAFSLTAFEDGIANMPWFDLIPELEETITSPAWQAAKDVEQLRNYLFAQLGMAEI
jgi:hypothetical protein